MRTVIQIIQRPHAMPLPGICALTIAVGLVLPTISPGIQAAELSCRDKPQNEKKIAALAGDLFARGERAFSEGQYIKALKRFLCSLYTFEHDATLTNIKEILKVVDPPEQASQLLDDYVALNPEGELTAEITAISEALKAGADIDEPATTEPPETASEPPIVEAPPQKTCISISDPAPFIRHAEAENRLFKLFGAITMGTGAAVLVTGAVLQGLSIGAGNDGDLQKKKQFQTGAVVGFVGGALTAGLGAAQFVLALKKQKKLQQLIAAPAIVEKCDSPKAADNPRVEAAFDAGFGSARITVRF